MMALNLNWKDHPSREEIYMPKVSEVVRVVALTLVLTVQFKTTEGAGFSTSILVLATRSPFLRKTQADLPEVAHPGDRHSSVGPLKPHEDRVQWRKFIKASDFANETSYSTGQVV